MVIIQTEAAQADNLVVKYRGHKCDYRSIIDGIIALLYTDCIIKLTYRWRRDMGIIIKPMETDDEKRGKAHVHWQSWHEAYQGIVSHDYLEKLKNYSHKELWVLKDNPRAIRFYEKYGFKKDGSEKDLKSLGATEIKMIL